MPTATKTAMARLSILRNQRGPMSKELSLAANGSLVKKPACELYEGDVRQIPVSDLSALARVVMQLQPNEALCYGITEKESATIVTQRALAATPGAVARDREHFKYPAGPGVMMFDYDADRSPLGADGVIATLRQALPELNDVSLMWRPSASSCIFDATADREVRGMAGLRIWILVSDAAGIPALSEILVKRLWKLGRATYRISKSGSLLERPFFDASVWQPERIDFAAGAICLAPLVQKLPPPQIQAGAVEMFDMAKIPTLTADELATAANNRKAERIQMAADAAAAREAWVRERGTELATRRGIEPRIAEAVVQRALDEQSLLPEFVLRSREHGELTVAEVLGDPDKFDGTRFADPLEPDYNGDDRVAWVRLKVAQPYLWSHAHGGARYELCNTSRKKNDSSDDVVDEMNKTFAFITIGKNAHVARRDDDPATGETSLQLLSIDAFTQLKRNHPHPTEKRGTLATYWLSHPRRREFKGLMFNPNQTKPGFLNLFFSWRYRAAPGTTTRYWAFVRDVICQGNEAVYLYVRRWMAHLMQQPHERPGTALVLRGAQGTGKNTFVDAFGELLGEHYVVLSSMEQVTGKFNGHTKHALLVFANEALWGGTRSHTGVLKAMITDSTIAIEQKGVDIFQIDNFRRVVVASNEKWAVPADIDDRRFVFLDVSPARANDRAYFAEIRRELEAGGYAALMHDLMMEDLEGFDPAARPTTGFGFDVKLRSATSFERWLHDLLTEGGRECHMLSGNPGFDWTADIPKADVYRDYTIYCRVHGERYPDDQAAFHKQLRAVIPTLQDRRPSGKATGTDRRREYRMPSLVEARKAFEIFMRAEGQVSWPAIEPEDDRGVQRVRHLRPIATEPPKARMSVPTTSEATE